VSEARVVRSLEDLTFIEKRLPRVMLRITWNSVEIAAHERSVRVSSIVTVVQQGERRAIVGIAGDPVRDPAATTLDLFSAGVTDRAERQELVEDFLQRALKKLPASDGMFRPVVVVENVEALAGALTGREREVLRGALGRWGAVAIVMP
jgi:hypothetical protein